MRRCTKQEEAWVIRINSPITIYTILNKAQIQVLRLKVYDICRNIEGVMNMFSEELRELGRTRVAYEEALKKISELEKAK